MPSVRRARHAVDGALLRGTSAPRTAEGARSPVRAAARAIAAAPSHAGWRSAVRRWCAVDRLSRAVVRRRRAVHREDRRVVRSLCAVARPCRARPPTNQAPLPWRRAPHACRRARRLLPHALRHWPLAERRKVRSRLRVHGTGHRVLHDAADRSGRAAGPGRRIGAVSSTRDHTPHCLYPWHPPSCQRGRCARTRAREFLSPNRAPAADFANSTLRFGASSGSYWGSGTLDLHAPRSDDRISSHARGGLDESLLRCSVHATPTHRTTQRNSAPPHPAPPPWGWTTRSGSTRPARVRRCRGRARTAQPAGATGPR